MPVVLERVPKKTDLAHNSHYFEFHLIFTLYALREIVNNKCKRPWRGASNPREV